jgi:hypothetical protein
MAAPLLSLRRALEDRAKRLLLGQRKSGASVSTTARAPGVDALDVGQLVADLTQGQYPDAQSIRHLQARPVY